jgi:hypothetical protein
MHRVLARSVQKHRLEPGTHEVSTTVEEANKALVLEAVDTLFNKRGHPLGAHRPIRVKLPEFDQME